MGYLDSNSPNLFDSFNEPLAFVDNIVVRRVNTHKANYLLPRHIRTLIARRNEACTTRTSSSDPSDRPFCVV